VVKLAILKTPDPFTRPDNQIHGDVTPDQVPILLEEYLKKARE
jgi:hypothetical protein